MTLWHNSTTGAGQQYWEHAIAEFENENPGVTITVQAIQNEDMDGKLQTALNAGDAPDIFLHRGGGKMTAMVKAGQVMDLTGVDPDDVKGEIPDGTFKAADTYQDKTCGMPTSMLPGGIFYSKDAFEHAGITDPPKYHRRPQGRGRHHSRATGIPPIALGAKDAWPAAHWYYFFALRECCPERPRRDGRREGLQDPCWSKPARTCRTSPAQPFNEGFLTTYAPAGRRVLGRPHREPPGRHGAHGRVGPGVIASLTPDEKPLPDLGWFPFPESRR